MPPARLVFESLFAGRSSAAALFILGAIASAGAPGRARAQDYSESAMSSYVRCLEDVADRLKDSCEPADVVADAIVSSCAGARDYLQAAILPYHRFYEEARTTALGIEHIQRERMLSRLVQYRLGQTCPRR